jgi:hypothetical protein
MNILVKKNVYGSHEKFVLYLAYVHDSGRKYSTVRHGIPANFSRQQHVYIVIMPPTMSRFVDVCQTKF